MRLSNEARDGIRPDVETSSVGPPVFHKTPLVIPAPPFPHTFYLLTLQQRQWHQQQARASDGCPASFDTCTRCPRAHSTGASCSPCSPWACSERVEAWTRASSPARSARLPSNTLSTCKKKTSKESNIVAMVQLFSTLGALVGYAASDRFGRVMAGRLSCLLIIAGSAMWMGSAERIGMLYVGRMVTGVGVGISSVCSPVFFWLRR